MRMRSAFSLSGWIVTTGLVVAGVAGCGSSSPSGTAAAQGPTTTPAATPTRPPATAGGQPAATAPAGGPTQAPSWPTPEDCVRYNPNTLAVSFANDVYTVTDGSVVVLTVAGQSSDDTGTKALALAQHYRRHCYIGRNNTRSEKDTYIFDYWRDSSGLNPTIPDQENDCSDYNRNNLTVEDMGDGNGWRVKDHDHVLQLFDNGQDAANGKLVLSKYRMICVIGSSDNDNQLFVNYML